MAASAKTIVRQFFDALNRGDLDGAADLCSPKVVAHMPIAPKPFRGRKAFRGFLGSLLTAFPDLKLSVDEMIGSAGSVATWLTVTGSHEGEFAGIPASGKTATWTVIHFTRVEDGKIAEDRVSIDQLSLLSQLGVM